MHHVTPSKIADIVGFLNRHDAVYFSGYPSILHALAALGLEQGLTLQRRPRYVVTGAESLLEHQRTAIETFTGARITDQYGFSEACGNAAACPAGAYHEDFELGLIECVDPVTLPDGNVAGKIVCTGFANPWFPFIRYEVGDQGVWAPDDYQCPCGRKSRVLMRIEGRLEDYVLTPEGRRIARFDYVFKDTERVREVQVVQERLGEVILKVVRRSGYSATDEDFIRREMQRWISPALATKFDYVEHIPRTKAGKFRAVHSLLLPQNERHADAP
jgi:phenylacetate-CoA ligase